MKAKVINRLKLLFNIALEGDFIAIFRRIFFVLFGKNLNLPENLKPNYRPKSETKYRQSNKPFILIALPNLNLEGAPISGFELAAAFKKSGKFDVKLISPFEGPLRSRIESAKLDVEIIEEFWPNFGSFSQYEKQVHRLASKIKSFDVDLIFAVTIDSFPILDAGAVIGIPMIWNIREGGDWRQVLADRNPKVSARALACFHYCETSIFVAQSSIETWSRFISDNSKMALIRNPIPDIFKDLHLDATQSAEKEEFVILNVGTICERKGQIDLIKASHKLAGAIAKPIRIKFAGRIEEKYYTYLKRHMGNQPNINYEFLGTIDDMSSLYKSSDVIVNCARREAFPRVLLEASATGIPIVASNVDGISELLSDGVDALLYETEDCNKLAKSIAKLANDKALAKQIAKAAQIKLSKNGGITEVAIKYIDLIEKSLKPKEAR